MEIPKTIKIGGHELDVVVTNDSDIIPDNNIGLTITAKNVIYLNSRYPQTQLEEALLHEILHNLYYSLSLEQSEEIIQRLGFLLYATLKENKCFGGLYEPNE